MLKPSYSRRIYALCSHWGCSAGRQAKITTAAAIKPVESTSPYIRKRMISPASTSNQTNLESIFAGLTDGFNEGVDSKLIAETLRKSLRAMGPLGSKLASKKYEPMLENIVYKVSQIDPNDLSIEDMYMAMNLLPYGYVSSSNKRLEKALGQHKQGMSSVHLNRLGDVLFDLLEIKLSGMKEGSKDLSESRGCVGIPWIEVSGALSGMCWLRRRRPGVSDQVLEHVTSLLYGHDSSYQYTSPEELGSIISSICHKIGIISCTRVSSVLGFLRGVYLCALHNCNDIGMLQDDASIAYRSRRELISTSTVRYNRAVRYSPRAISAALMGFQNFSSGHEEVSAMLFHFCHVLKSSRGAIVSIDSKKIEACGSTSGRVPLFRGIYIHACLKGMCKMRSNDEYAVSIKHLKSTNNRIDFHVSTKNCICPANMIGGPAVRELVAALAFVVSATPVILPVVGSPVINPTATERDAVSYSDDNIDNSDESVVLNDSNNLIEKDVEFISQMHGEELYTVGDICSTISMCQGFSDGYIEVRHLLSALADKLIELDQLWSQNKPQLGPLHASGKDISDALYGLHTCHHSLTISYPTQKLLGALAHEVEKACRSKLDNSDTIGNNHYFSARQISRCFYGFKKMESRSEFVMRIVHVLRQVVCKEAYDGHFNSIDIGMFAEGIRFLPCRNDDVKAIIGFLADRISALPPETFTSREVSSCLFALQNMDYMSEELCRYITVITAVLRNGNISCTASQCAMSLLALRLKPLTEPCILELVDALTQQITNTADVDTFSKYDTVDLQIVLKDLRDRHPAIAAKAMVASGSSNIADRTSEDLAYNYLFALRTALLCKVKRNATVMTEVEKKR